MELSAVCEKLFKKFIQTDQEIVWIVLEDFFRLPFWSSPKHFGFIKDSSKFLERSFSFQALHNDMTHVLKRPCSGREKCRKAPPSRPRLSRAV